MLSGVTLYDTFVVLAILVLCLYLYLTRNFNYWKKHGIPYVEPLPFFGNLKEAILQNLYAGIVLEHIYRKYKHERYVGIFAFDRPALLVNDLDLIKNIMVKDSQNFMNRNIRTDEKIDPIWTNFLFALKGERWKHVRNKLTPTFTSGKMKTMFYLVNNCGKDLTYILDNISADEMLTGVTLYDTFVVLAILVLCLYLYLTRNFNYWKKHGIPYVEPLPFFGNLKEAILQNLYAGIVLEHIYRKYKHERYVGIFAFDRPALLVNDLDLIRNIMVKDSQNFINRNIRTDDKIDPIWTNFLFALKGERWKHVRNKLTPTFTSGKMKTMFYLVNNCGKDLTYILDNVSADGSPVPVKETLSRFTTDAIATCALGIESNSLKNPNSEVRRNMRKVFDFSVIKGFATILMFFAPKVSLMLKMKYLDDDTSRFFRNTVWEAVKYREQHGVVRKDLLDGLIELRKKGMEDSEKSFDGDLFIGQAFAIFIGGFETSSASTTFLLYEMAKHPEIQSKFRTEICEVLQKHNNEVTYEAIQEMKYLDMVVSETLRKYPVLGFLDRVCNTDYELPGPSGKGVFTLKAGTSVYIPLLGIHYNPEYFPDPDKFDPERFTEENKLKRHNYSYFPFGEGPRICIGKRFGLMQMKTALTHILSKFEVLRSEDTPVQPSYESRSFILQSKHEIYLTFRKVNV